MINSHHSDFRQIELLEKFGELKGLNESDTTGFDGLLLGSYLPMDEASLESQNEQAEFNVVAFASKEDAKKLAKKYNGQKKSRAYKTNNDITLNLYSGTNKEGEPSIIRSVTLKKPKIHASYSNNIGHILPALTNKKSSAAEKYRLLAFYFKGEIKTLSNQSEKE